jgi:hypothetical protein
MDHLGAERLGREPAVSAALGRRRRDDIGHAGDAARRAVVRPVRLHLLEPRHRRLRQKTPRELYSRWLPFGALVSHTRAHGQAPKEPWHYDAAFVDEYRRAMELRYALMPYIYAQARQSSSLGHPMTRTLFFEFPTTRRRG